MNIIKPPIHYFVGDKIRVLREQKQLTQSDLAQLTGTHRTYIGHIERGEKNISLHNLQKITEALGVDIHLFFKDYVINE